MRIIQRQSRHASIDVLRDAVGVDARVIGDGTKLERSSRTTYDTIV
jgi:hypothetical protein